MGRREFITLLCGGVAAGALAARAQEPSKGMRRVGLLMGMADDPEGRHRVIAFQQRLHELGWTEGQNVQIDVRWAAADPVRIRDCAAELVGLAPDVIVGASTPVAKALQQATKSVPIVFTVVNDAVGHDLAGHDLAGNHLAGNHLAGNHLAGNHLAGKDLAGKDLAGVRPRSNLTGFTTFEFSMGGKWIEILKEIAPRTSRVGVMFDPAHPINLRQFYAPSIDVVGRSSGLELIDLAVGDSAEIERTLDHLAEKPGGGVVVLPDATTVRHRELITASMAKRDLPAIYPYRYFAKSGGLISYGMDTVDLYQRAASYADRILRGAKPAELPVQQPYKFELVINLRSAKALGLDIPPALLARANEVHE